MDEVHLANKDYYHSGALSIQKTYLRRYLSSLARHQRTLKIRLKRQIAEPSSHKKSLLSSLLTKKIAKHARIKRKIIMLGKRIHNDNQDPLPYRALQLLRLYTERPAHMVNLQRVTELASFNGMDLSNCYMFYIQTRKSMTSNYTSLYSYMQFKLTPCRYKCLQTIGPSSLLSPTSQTLPRTTQLDHHSLILEDQAMLQQISLQVQNNTSLLHWT